MKAMNSKGWILFICVFTGLFFSACSDSSDPESKSYTYYVSNESKAGVTAQDIRQKILLAQMLLPQVAPFVELVKNDVDVQKIVYKTTFQNKSIKASGLVYLPKSPGNYPVLSFQNGTTTERSKAPSVTGDSEMLFMLQCVASMGYIVVIPDYIGFGESSSLPHPYLHAESTTLSILNMLRAMKEFTTENDLPAQPTKDLFLFGYSQGGWATLLLQKEIETKGASEFNLKASASAAGPYSLDYMYGYITTQEEYPAPYFTAYLINAYTSLGMVSNPVSDF
ncbi:MAG TPA: lipase family protein, partial [Prolixibacteraceae bacterium]|nr:lipase family protein [Prolixibacteraceae bacterium]